MSGDIKIVHLSPKDWKIYKELRLSALKVEPQAFGKSYKDAAGDPDNKWIERLTVTQTGKRWSVFAQVNNELIGMLEATIHSDEPNRVWLHATYVEKKYRGKGIAERMMKQILYEISESNAPKIVKLGVNKKQVAAVNLYEKLGFVTVDKQDYIMGNGVKAKELVMEKQL